MADLSSWIEHFKKMATGTLPPDSTHIVRNRGGGQTHTYLKVVPTVISPAQQVVNQAQAKVADKKPVNRRKRQAPAVQVVKQARAKVADKKHLNRQKQRSKPVKASKLTGRGVKSKHKAHPRAFKTKRRHL